MVKEKYDVYHKAFKEFMEIVKFFSKNEYKKIPKSFIHFIEENMDDSYEYTVEHVDDFQNQEMLEETRVLLSIVYRDYLASDEEKERIIKIENEEYLQEEKIKQEKYDINALFEKRANDKIKIQNEVLIEKNLIVVEEKWYKKLLNKIREFFGL